MSKTPYLFSYKESDDLFFNMTRITDENYSEWNSLKRKDICGGSRLGIQGFFIDHYNVGEVWVAFASCKKPTNYASLDFSTIEMFVGVSTSEGAPFTMNMGIQRIETSFAPHKNISIKLHSFASKVMLDLHPEKIYMINFPVFSMLSIIYDYYKAHELMEHIHFLSEHISTEETYIDKIKSMSEIDNKEREVSLEAKYKDCATRRSNIKDCNRVMSGEEIQLFLAYKQIEKSPTGERIYKISSGKIDDRCFFNLYDKANKLIFSLDHEEMSGEFGWFFKDGLGSNSSPSDDPTVIYDLDILASFIGPDAEIIEVQQDLLVLSGLDAIGVDFFD